MEKSEAQMEVTSGQDADTFEARVSTQDQKGVTIEDCCNMSRMGKYQMIASKFRFISIVGFIMVIQATWKIMLPAAGYGLQ